MAFCSDDIQNLREWSPLTDLFNKVPLKAQNGLFSQDVKITCIDVLPDFLALGTNVGCVYWYDRKKKDLQNLQCEKQKVYITAIKVISTVDYMVACGGKDGSVNMFQIPKSHPDTIPESLKPKNKQIERYTVLSLHKSPVTAIEWSKNGMKLFSGDQNGCVVLTEIDFYMHICKSVEIFNETYTVVQLSYFQQLLLVSTTYRSIICQKSDKWKVAQVGRKDRKVLGNFGGIFLQNGAKPQQIAVCCSRPGLRIWIADQEGNVNKTLLFKELLCKECPEIPIINPINKHFKSLKPQKEPSFGIIVPFHDNLIVTYNNDVIYILDPRDMKVISTMSHFRSVQGVAAHKDEIFVLEEERSIIRVSFQPEPTNDASIAPNTPIGNTFLPLSTPVKDLTSKLQSSHILSAITPFAPGIDASVNIHTDSSLIMNAEEATESPIKYRRPICDTEKRFDDIGKQEFHENILFKQSKQKKRHSTLHASVSSLSSNSSDEYRVKPMMMGLSSVGVLPDLRSPESIQSDIEYKEKILADILDLGKVNISVMDNLQEKSDDEEEICDSDSLSAEKLEEFVGISKETKCDEMPDVRPVKAPVCLAIPNDWHLSRIELNVIKGEPLSTDNSLAEWEII